VKADGFHAFCARHRLAARGDADAASNYDRLAALGETPESRAEQARRAEESRASARTNSAAIEQRMKGGRR
jgi:hypothetical protein